MRPASDFNWVKSQKQSGHLREVSLDWPQSLMKSEMTSLFLTFVLGVLAIAGVVFALQTIFLTHEFRLIERAGGHRQ